MFIEFEPEILERWNHLSDDERQRAISEGDVDIAATVEIILEAHGEIDQEHKYYHVTRYSKLLGGDITINSITEQEIIFYFKNAREDGESERFSVKIGEEKLIQVGRAPYVTTYKIKAYNLSYGQIMEL